MRFHADHYFQIGSMHYQAGKACQDYALSGASDSAACAVVSDGCSTGRHTDVGSRVQAFSLLRAMRGIDKSLFGARDAAQAITREKKRFLAEAKTLLDLTRSDMLATSAYAYLSTQGGFAHIEGDGAVAKKWQDGSISATLYEWKDNTPFYPAYAGDDLASFILTHGGSLDAPRITATHTRISPDGTESSYTSEHTLGEGLAGIVEEVSAPELVHLDFLAVFTDGVAQMQELSWTSAVREFMAFKNTEGEFAKRRTIRALKQYERDGHAPSDDVGMAVIRVIHEEERDVDTTLEH